ncbi:hypothetical protein [Arcobacter defluvii]|uniref:Uncharacterized protein n=1 Tax=Arcobacter defluvii TaxID=873191 RepID=A0AAE7E5Z3_9BACT|nr:hypothetical protein [Arcobacter defluvii]QKF77345.1 hypothetical protein ADFLV_1313 [Arcobacter defluvii]RXI29606.1 hypothetical protein CP964_13240 [Arcobacter defluvii]
MKYTNADICELVAKLEGFIGRETSSFNINEWYGFNNSFKQTAYFKVCQGADKNGTGKYNFYKNKLPTNKIFIIIKDGENFCYREASFNEFDYTQSSKISIAKNNLNNFKHLIWDEEIIEQINATNVVYNRICNRNEEVNKKAIEDLLNQNPKQCYYCGIDMKTINELNNASILNSSLSWHHSKGLTKRTTRMTLEVEQLNPNGGYVKGNIVWACSWCNNAKTDTFTEDEFKNIACGINIAWNDRLQQIGSNSKVIFPWQNQVKCCK